MSFFTSLSTNMKFGTAINEKSLAVFHRPRREEKMEISERLDRHWYLLEVQTDAYFPKMHISEQKVEMSSFEARTNDL